MLKPTSLALALLLAGGAGPAAAQHALCGTAEWAGGDTAAAIAACERAAAADSAQAEARYRAGRWYLARFLASAKSARGKKIGIWALPHSDLDYYIGNKDSYRVHRPDCPQARSIKAKNRAEFDNLFDAADAGFAFCRTCKP